MLLSFPLEEITETPDGDYEAPVKQAYLATCACNRSDVFHVFQLMGMDHFHIQCAECETSFCPSDLCANNRTSAATYSQA
jgi:hypothetical protein